MGHATGPVGQVEKKSLGRVPGSMLTGDLHGFSGDPRVCRDCHVSIHLCMCTWTEEYTSLYHPHYMVWLC